MGFWSILKLITAIVVAEFAGVVGVLFTEPEISTWYAGLLKPALNPPAWVFAPVWTTLFLLMGIAAFLVWEKGFSRFDVKFALGVFIGQLVLNSLWSIIFFGLHFPYGAFIELILFWFVIVFNAILFYRISKVAGWLFIPYIIWVAFAGYLNYSVWMLN